LDTPIQKINVHVRGGYIIPMIIPGPNLILSRGNPFQLLVALSSSLTATGTLFWDDGDAIGMFAYASIFCLTKYLIIVDSIETQTYNYFAFIAIYNVSKKKLILLTPCCFYIYPAVNYKCRCHKLQRFTHAIGYSESTWIE
jgi:hypothetical protein